MNPGLFDCKTSGLPTVHKLLSVTAQLPSRHLTILETFLSFFSHYNLTPVSSSSQEL